LTSSTPGGGVCLRDPRRDPLPERPSPSRLTAQQAAPPARP